MSLSGISSPLTAPIADPRLTRGEDRATTATPQRADAIAPQAAPAAAPVVRQGNASTQSEAPAGTDPALWSVLTAEERAFFARTVTNGPLTYSRMTGHTPRPAAAAMPTGGRVDVRV